MTAFAAQHIFSTDRNAKSVATELLLREHNGLSLPEILNIPGYFKKNVAELMQAKAAVVRHLLVDYPLHQFFINVSPCQASSSEFIQSLEAFNNNQVPTTSISLEITERWESVDESKALANISLARQKGFSIVVDDFGSAGISLTNLASIRPAIVKLDMSLIQQSLNSVYHRKILGYTVRMIHDLGAKVVAEGVESEALYKIAQQTQCDYVQGFHFDAPRIVDLTSKSAS